MPTRDARDRSYVRPGGGRRRGRVGRPWPRGSRRRWRRRRSPPPHLRPDASIGSTSGTSSRRAYTAVTAAPSAAPPTPPSAASTTASTPNASRTCRRVAPTARRTPISDPSFEHRDHHHVGDPDPTDQAAPRRRAPAASCADGCRPRPWPRARRTDATPRPRSARPGWRSRPSTSRTSLTGLAGVARRCVETVPSWSNQRSAAGKPISAVASRLLEQRHRVEDPDHRPPSVADPHHRRAVERVDPQPLGGGRAQHDGRRRLGRRRRASGPGRNVAADGRRATRDRRRRRRSRRSRLRRSRSVRRTVAPETVAVAAASSTGPIRRTIAGASSGRREASPKIDWPARTCSRLVPSLSSSASRSALLDAEIPTTATSAAMPIEIPIAVSIVRTGRERASPTVPVRARSTGRRRLTMPARAAIGATARSIVLAVATVPSCTADAAREVGGDLAIVGDHHHRRTVGMQRAGTARGSPPRCGCRGCRSARRRATAPARPPAPGRSPRVGARRPTAGSGRCLARSTQPDPLEGLQPRGAGDDGGSTPGVHQRHRHVLDRAHRVDEMELLEHEADRATTQLRQARGRAIVEMSRPTRRTVPVLGRSRHPTTCSNVLLPEPDGPTIATISPRSMRRSTSRRASTPPGYVLPTPLRLTTDCSSASRARTAHRRSLVHPYDCVAVRRWWCTVNLGAVIMIRSLARHGATTTVSPSAIEPVLICTTPSPNSPSSTGTSTDVPPVTCSTA